MSTGVFPAEDDGPVFCGRCRRPLEYYRREPFGVHADGTLTVVCVCPEDCYPTV